MSLLIFHEEFRTEDDCFNWLFLTRWSHGFTCPRCNGNKYSKISTRELDKYQNCNYCVTTNTITNDELMKKA